MLRPTRFAIILTTVLTLFLSSCQSGFSDPEPEPPKDNETATIILQTSIADMLGSTGIAPGDNLIDDIKAYIFTNNTFVQAISLTSDQHTIEVDNPDASRIYVVANTHTFPALANLQAGISPTEALSDMTSTDATPAQGASLFLMGYRDIKVGDKTATVDCTRGVARIDVKSNLPAITIAAIRIENTAASSALLPISQSTTTSRTANLTKTFDTPQQVPQLGVFYLYEHNNQQNCIVEIDAISDNIKTTVKAHLPPKVKRNTIYEIFVREVNGQITCQVNSLDWSTGGIIDAQPDLISKITIDPQRSNIPDTVLVDVENSEITVPGWGSNFSVAFTSDVDINVIPQSNTPTIQFTKIAGEINKYNVTVAPQDWNTGPYSAEYGLHNPLLQEAQHSIKITVKDKPYVIPTATLGGIEWMAFNSQGTDGLQQTRLSAGQTVEDVYNTRYPETMGLYYHWGRLPAFVPWENTNANTSDPQDKPWTTDGKMPCPPHFKVPSESDYAKIYPANTPIPSNYSVNDIDYRISYVNPSAQITLPSNAKINPRYVIIEEVISGEKLFLPLAGYKGDKEGGAGWNMGTRLVLWTSQPSSTGGHARIFNISDAPVGSYPELPMEAFATLRCIRK